MKWYINIIFIIILVVAVVRSADAGPMLTGCPTECVCSSREAQIKQNQHQQAYCSDMPTSDLATTVNTLQITGAELGNITGNVTHYFHHLTSLDMTACGVTGIEPGAFDDVPQLLSLFLSHNRIVELELGTFTRCRKLRKLYLDHNYLEVLDDAVFSKLDSLEYLNLQGNKLTKIPNKLPPKLREINLSDNNIGPSISPLLHQVDLKNLSLCGNPLKELPSIMFDNMPNLQVLCVATPLPKGTHTKIIHLANLNLLGQNKTGTQMDETTITEISHMESLRVLSIKCRCGGIVIIRNDKNEQYFKNDETISRNKESIIFKESEKVSESYYTVPDLSFLNNLTKLLHLTMQHVSSKKHIDLDAAFQDKKFLQTLILEGSHQLYNDFIANTKILKGLRNLTVLGLSDNNISTLRHTSVPDNRHLNIDIRHNPLYCDCQLAWLTHQILLFKDDTYCSSPPPVSGKLLAKVINEMDCPKIEYFTTNSSHDTEHSGYKDDTVEETDNSTLYIILGCILIVLVIAGIVLAIVYKRYRKSGSSTITTDPEPEESQMKNIKQSTSSKDHLLKK